MARYRIEERRPHGWGHFVSLLKKPGGHDAPRRCLDAIIAELYHRLTIGRDASLEDIRVVDLKTREIYIVNRRLELERTDVMGEAPIVPPNKLPRVVVW